MSNQGWQPLPPVLSVDLFPRVLEELLALLAGLTSDDWAKPTACPDWPVKDVAAHLLGDDLGLLSRKRDGFIQPGRPGDNRPVAALLNDLNHSWVEAARRLSPRLLQEMLALAGAQVCDYFRGLEPWAMGGPVSWAGPGPAPVWLDIAREYTERWHHQQHIRQAVSRPGLREPEVFAPVLATYVRCLPHTYRGVAAPEGATVTLVIGGASGGRWTLRREGQAWALYAGATGGTASTVGMDEDIAWRLFTRGGERDYLRHQIKITGDGRLGEKMLDAVAIIA